MMKPELHEANPSPHVYVAGRALSSEGYQKDVRVVAAAALASRDV